MKQGSGLVCQRRIELVVTDAGGRATDGGRDLAGISDQVGADPPSVFLENVLDP